MIFNDNFRQMDHLDLTGNIVRPEEQIQTTNFDGNANSRDELTPVRFLNQNQIKQQTKGKIK
jgi:hypothetical protein